METEDADGFISAVANFVEDPTEENLDRLNDARIAFIAGINPVVAYVYFYL